MSLDQPEHYMHSMKGFVYAVKRPHDGAFIHGWSSKILEAEPLELVPFDNIAEAKAKLERRMRKNIDGDDPEFFIAQLQITFAVCPMDEEVLSREHSLVVFWKNWNAHKSHWHIAGKGNVLLSLKPYLRSSSAVKKLRDIRLTGGLAMLAQWRITISWRPEDSTLAVG